MLPRDYHHDVAEGFTPNTYITDKAPHGSTGTRISHFTMNDAVAYCSAKGGASRQLRRCAKFILLSVTLSTQGYHHMMHIGHATLRAPLAILHTL